MRCELEETYANLASSLPEIDGDEFSLHVVSLPRPPTNVLTGRLVIEKSHHDYNGVFRQDRLFVHATKATYCHLGLFIASVLFAQDPTDVVLDLVHPASQVRRLIVRRSDPRCEGAGFHSKPHLLNYYASRVSKHPWLRSGVGPFDLPAFLLTNVKEEVYSEDDWARRDTIFGFGADAGTARLIELLLNLSRIGSTILEVELEGDAGFRGVAPLSAEVTFLLPGAFGWDDRFGLR